MTETEAKAEIEARLRSTYLFAKVGEAAMATLTKHATTASLEVGELLAKQGDVGDALYLILSGRLDVLAQDDSLTVARQKKGSLGVKAGELGEGELFGELQVVVGGRRLATAIATEPCRVLVVSRATVDEIAAHDDAFHNHLYEAVDRKVALTKLRRVFNNTMPFASAELIDILLQAAMIREVPRGTCVFAEGDPSDTWCLLISGRLVVTNKDATGKPTTVAQIRPGESFGELALFLDETRQVSIYARRTSQIAMFPRELFRALLAKYAELGTAVGRMLAERLTLEKRVKQRVEATTVAIFHEPGLNFAELGPDLRHAFGKMGAITYATWESLSRDLILPKVPPSLDHPVWSRLGAWADDVAKDPGTVIFDVSDISSTWARWVLSFTDHIVFAADVKQEKPFARIDSMRASLGLDIVQPPWNLLLVSDNNTKLPTGTADWLQGGRFTRHIHIRRDSNADIERAARLILNRGVGLALGGGGARGFAHIGVLRALHDLRIPVDYIAGTSMGAIMAGQYAMGLDFKQIRDLNLAISMTKPFTEYTVPMISLLKSQRIEEAAKMAFADVQVEDLWLNYFCVSANLTRLEPMIHERGPLWLATRASSSLPGIALPVLSGGELLVDGGVINNMPGDWLRERCGGPVIAVNVSPPDKVDVNMQQLPSQWSVFWGKVLPWREPIQVPGISGILMRTLMLASASRTQSVATGADIYLSPPVEEYSMLGFDDLDKLIDCGYNYARRTFEDKPELMDRLFTSDKTFYSAK